MTKTRFTSLALEVARGMRHPEAEAINFLDIVPEDGLVEYARLLLARVREEAGKEAVAWMYEYEYDLNGDKQGHWLVDIHKYVAFSRTKTTAEASPLFLHPQEDQWISVEERLPEKETPVLIMRKDDMTIGEIRWEHPGFEETFESYWYWDDPTDDGQDWERELVTHWMPLPKPPAAKEQA